MRVWRECHPPRGQCEVTWPWKTEEKNSPDQSCGRFVKQQQGGCALADGVGGDTIHCGWRLMLGPDISKRVWLLVLCWWSSCCQSLIRGLDIQFLSWYSWFNYDHARRYQTSWRIPHTLLNIWLSLNQKQTPPPFVPSSPIYHRCRSILFSPALSPSACPIHALPTSPARSLLAPRCFPLLPPLKLAGEMERTPSSLIFMAVSGGSVL